MAGLAGGPGLGQQLAMLQQASQMQKKFQDMIAGNGGEEPAVSAEEKLRLEEEKAREQAVEAAATSTKYRFRLCVYSGEELPRDNSYILVKLIQFDGVEKETRGHVSSISSHPVWEFFMEEDIMIHSVQGPPRIEITHWGQRVLTDKLDSYLGSTTLKLPNQATNGPVKQMLRMAPNTVTAMRDRLTLSCKEASNPVIRVVWQVCNENQLLPDLIRIAEKDDEASDKANYQFGARLLSATLRRPTEGSRRLGVSFKLITPDGEVSKSCPVQFTPLKDTKPELKFRGTDDSAAISADEDSCNQAIWKEDGTLGWVMPTWALRESEISLMSYMVEAHLFMYPAPSQDAGPPKKKKFQLKIRGQKNEHPDAIAEERPTKVGVWRETLGDILESIDTSGTGLICEAQIESKEGQAVAHLRLELDLFMSQPNRMPVSMVCRVPEQLPERPAPKRRGVPPQEIWHNKVQYYCSLMVDGLPTLEQAHEQTFPYVRITMGSEVYKTIPKDTHSVNYVNFDRPLVITTTVINRKAKIEIMAKQVTVGGLLGEDKVLGEANIFDITCDKDQEQEYCIHCFGGAIRAPNDDVAQQMVKGAVRPASTYTGTVFVKFGNKMTTKDYFETIKKQLTRRRLVVRLYSGLNLGGFAGKKITIICRVPGCRLPDQQGAKKQLQLSQELDQLKAEKASEKGKSISHTSFAAKRKEIQEGLERGTGISFNNNILAFPGEVDDHGMLHFLDEKGTAGKRLKWVERSTPKAWPLMAPPNLTHVMLYVVVEGEETEPPTVFGRLRLSNNLGGPGNGHEPPNLDKVAPKWKRMRYDTSVVTLPTAYYKSDFAGFILGSATMVKIGSEDLECGSDGVPVLSPRGVTDNREPDGCCSSGAGTKKDLLPPDYSRNLCCGTTSLIQASLGEPEDTKFEYVAQDSLKTVYCHLDVLAARELPSMDSDGLIDPAYSIDVMDQSLLYPEGTMKSLSPSFMHRVCVPITLEVEPGHNPSFPLMASTIPFPPIVFKMLDRDDRKTMGFTTGEEFEEVGTVVIKHVGTRDPLTQKWLFPLLGYDEEKVVLGPTGAKFAETTVDSVDVNVAHFAMWHALDKPAKAPFDNSEIGVDASWAKRPRVLIAANYSLQEKLAPRCLGERLVEAKHSGDGSATIHMLATQESASFQIECSLLGLRNLPDSLVDAKFYVSSFWEGAPVELAIGSMASGPMQRNHNFMADEDETKTWKQFAEGVKSLVRFSDDDNNDAPDFTVPVVNLNDVCGIKIKAPIYEVPVLPYLQQDIIKSGRWIFRGGGNEMILEIHHEYGSNIFQVAKVDTLAHAETVQRKVSGYLDIKKHTVKFVLDEKEWNGKLSNQGKALRLTSDQSTFDGRWQEDDPWVLLPALTFQLKNCVTGADYGVLTVGMNAYRQPKQPPSNAMKRSSSGTLVEDDGSWLQLCIREFGQLPVELREWKAPARPNDPMSRERTGTIQALKGMRIAEDSYDVFVDVYASGAGWMQFDENNFIGKVLTDHCLFSIFESRDEADDTFLRDKTFTQFFNPCDFMAGDSRFNNEDFDDRVWPQLCCGPGWDKEPRQPPLEPRGADLEEDLKKSIAWLTNKQNKVDWKKPEQSGRERPRPHHPLGPKDHYAAFFKATQGFPVSGIPRRSEDLVRMSTKQITQALKTVGWRNVSHLNCPEPAKEPESVLGAVANLARTSGPDLSANRHTFMRPVGHRIGADRDSRILCRLRMDMPRAFIESQTKQLEECLKVINEPPREGDEGRAARVQQAQVQADMIIESLGRIDNSNSNYFVVKFSEPGLVVWAAPADQTVWDRPGTLLFAVRLLKNQDIVVPVTVPNFDLRRPKETAWFTIKNLVTRFRHLENKVERAKRQERANRKGSKTRKSPASPDYDDVEKGEDEKQNDSGDEDQGPNGFSRRVPVSTDGFVCRLKRRFGGKQYDRIQGNDWYRMVLREAFPEIDTLPDHVDTKTFFMSKFLNLRSTLALPSDQGETILKGHVQCTRVLEQGASNKSNMGEIEPPLAAIENLWTSSGVHANLYLLTFTKLEFTDSADTSELYFKVLCGNETLRVDVASSAKKDVDVYETLQFETQLPGAGIVRIQAWAKGTLALQDNMIGEMQLDLEDRWLCLRRKELRCQTNKDFLEANVSPKEYSRYYMVNPPDERLWAEPEDPEKAPEGKGCEVRPARSPGDRMPIESRFMLLQDEGGGNLTDRSRSGMLRYCLDLCPSTVQPPDIPPKVTTSEFEVRISVISVDNINVFKDFGQRNDLFVQLKYKAQSMDGSEVHRKEKTDVHRWAHQDASFNQRFIFPLNGPCTSAQIEFTLFDFDRVTSADMVYYPQVYSLDHLAQLAYRNWKEGREPISSMQEEVTFDSWPSKNILSAQTTSRLCSCCRRSRKSAYLTSAVRKAFYAKLHIAVELVPKDYADAMPVQAGQFAPPKDRLSVQMLATNPVKTMKVMLGPRLYGLLRTTIIVVVLLLAMLLCLTVIYYIVTLTTQGASLHSSLSD